MPPTRESDRLLQRIRTLVQDDRRPNGPNSFALEARRREIERLKTELADVVKRTAATDRKHL